MRIFNTEGPIQEDIHYFLPPLERIDLESVTGLIDQRKYFLLHAPRQTGKTTCLMALARHLNATERYRCVYANIEAGQALRENVTAANELFASVIAREAGAILGDDSIEPFANNLVASRPPDAFGKLVAHLAASDSRPLVLFLDEVDSLVGDTLLSLLRQLRSGYANRPARFAQSVILCGVRDLHDYRIHASGEKTPVTGGSAFNIKATSLRLGDFTQADIRRLYLQHTEYTGQTFDEPVFDRVWELTRGQPWLVNALAYEATFVIPEGKDRARAITVDLIEQAKERLIVNKVTHIDQLGDKLQEDRVRSVIAPMVEGSDRRTDATADDISYTIDLGLTRRGPAGLEIANPIYREVIPRYLTEVAVIDLESTQQTAWYVAPGGQLDIGKLLTAFQQWFRENSEHWVDRFLYKESGPQLVLQAWLQRIVNGGGRIEREYGLGRGRTDLVIIWPWPQGVQRAVLELKITKSAPTDTTIQRGVEQTWEYLQRMGAAEGHLVIFDRSNRTWDEKISRARRQYEGRDIEVWTM